MIEVDQALVKAFVDGAFGLPIAHENLFYEPTPGTAYAQLVVFQNDVTAYSIAHSDETDGVFQITLRYPVNKSAGPAKIKADAILSAFKIGTRLVYSTQRVTIMSARRESGVPEDGWYKIVLTINYKAFTKRIAA